MTDQEHPSGWGRILMVDDEAVNLRLLERMLEREGYTGLTTTTHPLEALERFDADPPDLVLLDLHMPEMDGFAVLAELRARISPHAFLPILVLTGDATPEARQRALENGATDFVTKPFDRSEVLLRIRNLLHTRGLHLRLQEQNRLLEARVQERTRDLQAALERAEAARQAKTQFLDKMSHELRTPLTPIRGALELLREQELPASANSLLLMASSNTERMVRLINEILYLQSIEQGAVTPVVRKVDMGELLSSVLHEATSGSSSTVPVRVEAPPGGPPLHTDPDRLGGALLRILDNALRFTEEGSVVVRAVLDPGTGQWERIEVCDSGVGIEPDRLDAILDPFEQADNSNTRRYEGAGIGLAICRALCRLLGYRLTVTSEPGRGSTFSILL